MNITQGILCSLRVKTILQSQITTLYLAAILGRPEDADWRKINQAIEAKWSTSALIRIKRNAFKMVKDIKKL